MKLFHVVGTVHGWDSYSDFVCAAPNAEAARRTYPRQYDADTDTPAIRWSDDLRSWVFCDRPDEEHNTYGEWDASIDTVTVTEIGDAASGLEAGVICSSFHAG